MSPAQALLFKTAYETANTDYLAREAARTSFQAASTTSQDSVRDLRRAASDTLRFIRAFAESSPKPDAVYAAAQIPPPGGGGPVGPPGTPFAFRAVLNPDGSITFRWKCPNPPGSAGTIYNIRRKLATDPQPVFIGAVGTRQFRDATIPQGTASVQYTVTAQRATLSGATSSPFLVQFGFGGGGGLTITSQGDAEPEARLAA